MPISRYFVRTSCVVVGLALSTFSLASCDLAKNQLTYDRSNNQDVQDYRDGLSPKGPAADVKSAAPMPEFQSLVATPSDLRLPSPLVTVSVNQTVSLRDLMFELAEQAGVDIEMDPQIHGSIIFTAKDRPFNEVVDRISEMAGLRYTFKNNVLRVELDRPYLKSYKLGYMSTLRKSASSIETGISAANSGGGSGGTSSAGGSVSKVDNANDVDFWKDIDAGLTQLLASSDTYVALASQEDPVAAPMAPPPPPLPVDGTAVDANGAPLMPPPAAVPPSLNVTAAPAAPVATSAPASYSVSKQAGVVSVFASERQHKLVQKFLDNYRKQAMTQVLIEAKVFEVALNDQFSTGIDWGVMSANLTRLISSADIGFPAPALTPAVTEGTAFTVNLSLAHGFKPVVSALSQFGTVRSLSSPRVTVMNNQQAVVNVAENLIFFNIDVTVTPPTDTAAATISYESEQRSVPEGVLLNVTPTVNPDTGEIMLAVRPTVTKKVADINDPSIALNITAAALSGGQPVPNADDMPTSFIPQMSVQEMDSIIKMQSGQTMVMGGLMKDSNVANQIGVPVLSDLPGVGALFRSHGDMIQKSELVIFLQATVVPGSNVEEMDRKIYKQFSNDTRPFAM